MLRDTAIWDEMLAVEPIMRQQARAIGADPDVVQDAFLRVAGYIERHGRESVQNMRSLLTCSVYNLWRERMGRRGPALLEADSDVSLESFEIAAPEGAENVEREDSASHVREALNGLCDYDRDILWRWYWLEESTDEIAAHFDCEPSNVKVRLWRARRRLGVKLGGL